MSNPNEALRDSLALFLKRSSFRDSGAVITDLDGTCLHEDQGRIFIPKQVEFGLRELHSSGRPFVLNSLRFPLSILRTFGREWYSISNSPIPTVTLNGSLVGYIAQDSNGEMLFEELEASPLKSADVDRTLNTLEQLLRDGIDQALLFYYPRDWRVGEVVWTPIAERILHVKNKYASASAVTAVELSRLREQLHSEDICMMMLLVDVPEDRLMAYQHTHRNSFVTRDGVDKLFGARRIANLMNFDLGASVGAGDTEMDRFLNGVGLALLVGELALEFRGSVATLRIRDSLQLGELLFDLAAMLGERVV